MAVDRGLPSGGAPSHGTTGTMVNPARAVFVRFSLGAGQSFDWRLATIAGMEVAKLVPWNSLLN